MYSFLWVLLEKYIIETILNLILIIIAVSFIVLLERKIMASIQRRKGPNFIGFFGVLQPIADAIKLLIKQSILSRNLNYFIFIIAPILASFLSITNWIWFPVLNINNTFQYINYQYFSDLELSLLFWVAINSINIWSIFFSSLSSNNSYAFFAGLRSIAQMLAYETFLGLAFLPILIIENSWSYLEITSTQSYHFNLGNFFCFFFNFILFFISVLAETNRTPFDLMEAEGELIAGYNVEYSGALFLFFYLAEYINIICSSLIITILFYKYNNLSYVILDCILFNFLYYSFYIIKYFYYNLIFNIKNYFILNLLICLKKNIYFLENYIIYLFFFFNIFIIIWLRASLPRLRYDQLIIIAWKDLLPLSLFLYLFYLILNININIVLIQ